MQIPSIQSHRSNVASGATVAVAVLNPSNRALFVMFGLISETPSTRTADRLSRGKES